MAQPETRQSGPWAVTHEHGGLRVRLLLDSITEGGSRLVTWELTYPRMIHAELMTHRAFSRNAASSRAIPTIKLRQRVLDAPAVPLHWGANQKGMQAAAEVADTKAAEEWWLRGRDLMAKHHEEGENLGLHKQIVNRVIEPWMHITVICSATDWANFFYLRPHRDAEPNFQKLASMMREVFYDHLPAEVRVGDWHLPLIWPEDHEEAAKLGDQTTVLKQVSTGRCARVSYLTHDGVRDLSEDVRLHNQLAATVGSETDPGHFSPFEHPAIAVGGRQRHGNFEGWKQYRAFFPREAGPNTTTRCERCGIWAGAHVRQCPRNI